ncbi:hypothetical protein DEO72_LG5g2234 [Vigna unguiculata]|uniref:Uncharacterized protein n=1 Tax=Vigna unguiculata TaxID=3917 RepID=A0A4D6M283_VIGUN|nr:hypothetical protein DEO72_LG5g2234 [Vigna unguiculata]
MPHQIYLQHHLPTSNAIHDHHQIQADRTIKLVSHILRWAIYLDPSVRATTRTLTLATLANPSHNSRVPCVHPPSRTITQEMSLSHNSRNATSRLAGQPSPPGATRFQAHYDRSYRLALNHNA